MSVLTGVEDYEMVDLQSQEMVFSSQKLKDSHVGIIGSGPVANFLCAYLSGLGIGRLSIMDDITRRGKDKREWLVQLSEKKGNLTDRLGDMVTKLNEDIDVMTYFSRADKSLLDGCTVIVDTTNNPESKHLCLSYSKNNRLISCSSDAGRASVHAYAGVNQQVKLDELLMTDYRNEKQGTFTSSIAAALAADEIRKTVCPIEGDNLLTKRLNYSLLLPERFSTGKLASLEKTQVKKLNDQTVLKHKRALVIGAGGIGTYVLIGLALQGMAIDIYDHDVVEPKNLNRQVLYFGAVGKNKAETVAKRLKCIDNTLDVNWFDEKATYDLLKERKNTGVTYDVVFSCVDTFASRKDLNHFCSVNRIPLVNGGINAFDCVVDTFFPGENHCLECYYDYRRMQTDQERAGSCNSLDANVVMPNAIAGSLMVGEAMHAVSEADITSLGDSSLVFQSKNPAEGRLFQRKKTPWCSSQSYYKNICRCHVALGGEAGVYNR